MKSPNDLQICVESDFMGIGEYIGIQTDQSAMWTLSGDNLYPTNTADNPDIAVGIGTSTPGVKLDIVSSDVWAWPSSPTVFRITNGAPNTIFSLNAGGWMNRTSEGSIWDSSYRENSGSNMASGDTIYVNKRGGTAGGSVKDMFQEWLKYNGNGTTQRGDYRVAVGETNDLSEYQFRLVQNSSNAKMVLLGADVGSYNEDSASGSYSVNANVVMNSISGVSNIAQFDASGSTKMVVSTGGNVGIGNSAPAVLLHVQSTSDTNVLRLEDSDGTCNHNPEAGSETVACSSDERLKTDIRDAASALDEFSRFRIKDYTIKSSGNEMTGVIAQEVMKVNPDMVTTLDDGTYMVDQPNPWKMIKAIQELKQENDMLKRILCKDHPKEEACRTSVPPSGEEIK